MEKHTEQKYSKMATNVTNPTNAPPRPNAPLPFMRSATGKATVKAERQKDAFNSGRDYPDEGAPLLTSEAGIVKANQKPYFATTSPMIVPASKEEMEALGRPDEVSQTQIKYLKEAVVMDVDAKLIISSLDQMKKGIFREARYPTLIDYMKSPYYRKLRESTIIAERISGLAKKTKLREAGRETVAGVRINPQLVGLYNSTERKIERKLRESGFNDTLKYFQKESKRLREDAFTQDAGPGFGAITSFDSSRNGRDQDFIPLMAGPYNKQLYFFDYLDMHSKAFEAWTHNPIAKRIVKVITQFVLGKGVKLTVMRALRKSEEEQAQQQQNQMSSDKLQAMAQRVSGSGKQQKQPADWKQRCQTILDRHWKMNKMHIRSKQMLRGLLVFGEQFPRYFDAPWGLKLRQIDPSTVWEVVTDPDDCENEFYLHQQYPTRYQTFVDLPVPTIKFIIRQVPSAYYYHMKINTTEGEVRGRSELFAILGWLKRLKEYATDRVIRNKMANLFVLDVAVDGGPDDVKALQAQFQVPPTPGSFFIHNKAAELQGVRAEVGASDTQGDWEMLLTIIAMGAGLSQQYLGMSAGGGKAEALVGTEPDIKTFEDYQELMEDFFLEDAGRVYERAKERGEIPKDITVTVEATFPALAEENRSEKLKDYAFGESMSWWSHRRTASAAAKEMQMTSYDYDQEQEAIAQEDATKEFLINTAYGQLTKGVDSSQSQDGSGASSGQSSGSSGKGKSGMGMGKLPGAGGSSSSSKQSVGESVRESNEDIAPGTSTFSKVSRYATTHNASAGNKDLPVEWRGKKTDEATGRRDAYNGHDPRDIAESIHKEAANLRYRGRSIGRRQDRVQTPDKVRDQKSLDKSDIITKAKRAMKHGNLNKESKPIQRFPRE